MALRGVTGIDVEERIYLHVKPGSKLGHEVVVLWGSNKTAVEMAYTFALRAVQGALDVLVAAPGSVILDAINALVGAPLTFGEPLVMPFPRTSLTVLGPLAKLVNGSKPQVYVLTGTLLTNVPVEEVPAGRKENGVDMGDYDSLPADVRALVDEYVPYQIRSLNGAVDSASEVSQAKGGTGRALQALKASGKNLQKTMKRLLQDAKLNQRH